MANSPQARKRARQTVRRREHNVSLKSRLRTAIKQLRKVIESGDKSGATELFNKTVSTIDSIADKGIIHKNNAARQKSRLSAAIKALS